MPLRPIEYDSASRSFRLLRPLSNVMQFIVFAHECRHTCTLGYTDQQLCCACEQLAHQCSLCREVPQ